METKKISIILPVYNIAAYLDECVASLTAQTYRNLEILLVNDGSTDDSGAICDAWAGRDERVRPIHKPNGGAASARNAGLDAASGELICFVDSDDAVEPEYAAHLVQTLEESGADIAVCGFGFWSRKGFEPQLVPTAPGNYSGEGYLRMFLQDWSCALLWNKIYRREVIGGLQMAEGHRIDDEFFTYQVCMNAGSVTVTDKCLYRYRLRASSVMQAGAARQEQILLDRIAYTAQRYEHIARQMPGLEPEFFADALDSMTRYWRSSLEMTGAQRQIRSWINVHRARVLTMRTSLRQRLAYLYILYLRRPTQTGEPESITLERDAYFD